MKFVKTLSYINNFAFLTLTWTSGNVKTSVQSGGSNSVSWLIRINQRIRLPVITLAVNSISAFGGIWTLEALISRCYQSEQKILHAQKSKQKSQNKTKWWNFEKYNQIVEFYLFSYTVSRSTNLWLVFSDCIFLPCNCMQ